MALQPTYLCRCQCITVADVDAAIAEGNRTINDVKRRTRAGMGLCQGIYCVDAIAHRLIDAGVEGQSIAPMTWRPPTRLVQIGSFAVPETGNE